LGMSRALSPAELPCLTLSPFSHNQKKKQVLTCFYFIIFLKTHISGVEFIFFYNKLETLLFSC